MNLLGSPLGLGLENWGVGISCFRRKALRSWHRPVRHSGIMGYEFWIEGLGKGDFVFLFSIFWFRL